VIAELCNDTSRCRIRKDLGRGGYLDKPEDLALYEYDGSIDKAPGSGRVSAIDRRGGRDGQTGAARGIPIVGRGAGTGLSGGAIARAGGLMISFARMNRILEIDLANERAVLRAGAS
jgi:glycolate oxidase